VGGCEGFSSNESMLIASFKMLDNQLILVQGGTISHGIQARTISGQASSEFSHIYFENTRKSLDAALAKVRELKEKEAPRSSL
jgi:hypothetical protein